MVEKTEEAWDILKKAESYGELYPYLKVGTYNNISCLYRKLGRFKAALVHLEQALTMEYKYLTTIKTDKEFNFALLQENPADTHLNLCAILSSIGKHDIAYLHALKALTFLQAEVAEKLLAGNSGDAKLFESRCTVLCIAYHNLGTELEFLKQKEDALKAYKKGTKFAEKYLTANNPLTKSLKNTATQVEDSMEKEKQRRMERDRKSSSRLIRTHSGINRFNTNQRSTSSQATELPNSSKTARVILRGEHKTWRKGFNK